MMWKNRIKQHLRSFLDDFLDVVFAEASVTSVVELANHGNGFGLRNRHDPDSVGFGAGSLRRLLHTEHHRPERRDGPALCHHRRSHSPRNQIGGRYGLLLEDEAKTSGAPLVSLCVCVCVLRWYNNQHETKKHQKKKINYTKFMVHVEFNVDLFFLNVLSGIYIRHSF